MNDLIQITYGVLFLAVLWFVRGKLETMDRHIGNTGIHQSELERTFIASSIQKQLDAHEVLDKERFGHITSRLDEILDELRKLQQ